MSPPRIVIVGAGPAGIRAAERQAQAGLRPVLLDEAPRAGGQIFRQPPPGFTRPGRKLYGSEAGRAQALHECAARLAGGGAVEHLSGHTVLGIDRARRLIQAMAVDGGLRDIPYDRLILATGASDRVAPVPGWQAAGVYTLGAAQIALKAQGVALGRDIVLAGAGPLLTLVAAQLVAAGAGVRAVLDTSPMRQQMRGAPGLARRPVVALRGVWMRARLRGLYQSGVQLESIDSGAAGVEALHWRDGTGQRRVTRCDTLALGWHLRAETHLADLAGCTFAYNRLWAQWLPQTDALGRAGPGLYLAGDGLAPRGADAAEVTGRLAATACLLDLGLPAPDPRADLRRLHRLSHFAEGIARAWPWPAEQVARLPDSAVLCRCEGITAGELRATAARVGPDANRVKALSRLGMGRCQGRYCQIAGAEVIAAAAGTSPETPGRLRGQAPVRPVVAGGYLSDPQPQE